MEYLQGFPPFVLYFGMGVGFVALFLAAYIWLTPHAEIALIRAGNIAAAIALAGSVGAVDLAIWAGIALLGQLVAYALTRALLPGFPARLVAGETAAAVTSASLHVGIGLINAAAMSY